MLVSMTESCHIFHDASLGSYLATFGYLHAHLSPSQDCISSCIVPLATAIRIGVSHKRLLLAIFQENQQIKLIHY